MIEEFNILIEWCSLVTELCEESQEEPSCVSCPKMGTASSVVQTACAQQTSPRHWNQDAKGLITSLHKKWRTSRYISSGHFNALISLLLLARKCLLAANKLYGKEKDSSVDIIKLTPVLRSGNRSTGPYDGDSSKNEIKLSQPTCQTMICRHST